MNIKFILVFLLAAAGFSACKKNDFPHQDDFERSYKAWLAFKASSGNSYRYEVPGYTWAGSSWLTTVTVREGKVVQRDFVYTVFNDVIMPENGWTAAEADKLLEPLNMTAETFLEREGYPFLEALQWTETAEDLGTKSRDYSSASALYTLDDIYDKARTEWLKNRSDASISFEANNNGLISSAGFIPNGCMDDCFMGIHIRSIEALE